MSEIDSITEMFMQQAVEDGNPEHIVRIIGKIQELLVSMFTLYIIMQGKEHQEHDDCDTFAALPDAITDFKRQLLRDIDIHIKGNCAVNGIVFAQTLNEKTYAEIMKTLNQAE